MAIFCFTDIEGSTEKWEKFPAAMGQVIALHNRILEKNVGQFGGQVIKHTGDGIFAIFDGPASQTDAPLRCALEIQKQIQSESWPGISELRVRMAFHSGQAEKLAGDYYGPVANRTARFMALGWGGQILVSEEVHGLGILPPGAALEDLGVHQVKDLPEPQQVYGLVHPDLKLVKFPPLKSLSHRPHNIPEPLTPFVGRERELAEVASVFADPHNRLLTLKGSGGMGKTRLGIQAGHALLKNFKHGAAYVVLETVSDPAQLPAAIGGAMRMAFYAGGDPRAELLAYLKGREMLLILDHFDQVCAGAGLLAGILAAAPQVKILVTSREKLNQHSESVIEVAGLDLASLPGQDAADSAAARLFLQRARKVKPDFSVRPGDEAALVEVCRKLDGMPLGLELAAAWAKTLTVAEISRRLDSSLAVLFSSDRDLPERQRSLRGVFDYSWKLLDPGQQRLYRDLGVFAGWFTADAAQKVGLCQRENILSLVDKSLVQEGADGRFRVPEHLRPFVQAKLEQSPADKQRTLDAHSRTYFGFLKENERALRGTGQAQGLADVGRDIVNIRKAWEWAVDQGQVALFGQGARGLGIYLEIQSLNAAWRPLIEKALELWGGSEAQAFEGVAAEESVKAYAVLSTLLAQARFNSGSTTGGDTARSFERSASLFKKVKCWDEAAWCLVQLSGFRVPDEMKKRCLNEAREIYRQNGDQNGEALAKAGQAGHLWSLGQKEEGKRLLEESLAVLRKLGNVSGEAAGFKLLGGMALDESEVEEGTRHHRRARDLYASLGNRQEAGWAMNHLGNYFVRRREWAEGLPFLEEGLTIFESFGYDKGIQASFNHLSEAHWALGDLDKALALVDQSLAHAGTLQHGDWYKGRAFMEKAEILLHQGGLEEALTLSEEGLRIMQGARNAPGAAEAVEIQAQIRLALGQPEKARDLFRKAALEFSQSGPEWRGRNTWAMVKAADAELAMGRGPEALKNYGRVLAQTGSLTLEDTTLAALKGVGAVLAADKKHLEALRVLQVCSRLAQEPRVQVSRSRYFEKTRQDSAALLSEVAGRLLPNVVSDTRAWAKTVSPGVFVKETVSKYCA